MNSQEAYDKAAEALSIQSVTIAAEWRQLGDSLLHAETTR